MAFVVLRRLAYGKLDCSELNIEIINAKRLAQAIAVSIMRPPCLTVTIPKVALLHIIY